MAARLSRVDLSEIALTSLPQLRCLPERLSLVDHAQLVTRAMPPTSSVKVHKDRPRPMDPGQHTPVELWVGECQDR